MPISKSPHWGVVVALQGKSAAFALPVRALLFGGSNYICCVVRHPDAGLRYRRLNTPTMAMLYSHHPTPFQALGPHEHDGKLSGT